MAEGTLRAPLAGITGLVMTQVWAGPFAMQLLALMGAEIIHVESRQRADPFRGGSWDAPVPQKLRDLPEAKHGYNLGPYNAVNLNKKGITLDLTKPAGKDIFMRLLELADFFVENYSPRVMTNFGLNYENLIKVKPNLIVVNQGAFGHAGRYWNAPGTGGQVEPMAGGTELVGYEGGDPIGSGALWCDPVSGYHSAAAVLTALHHRDRTGEGQQVDVSMQEANTLFHADALMQFSLNRTVRKRMGNHHVTLAPHSIYPCRDAKWIAIAVRNQEEWLYLCNTAGRPEWQADSRFATMAARKTHEIALDEAISAWTAAEDADALESQLAAARVPAAKVRDSAQMSSELHYLRERGYIVKLDHPEAGELEHLTAPFRFSRTKVPVKRSPMHGENSWEVLSTYLGMTRGEYDGLVEQGITGEGPPPEWTPGSSIGRTTPPPPPPAR